MKTNESAHFENVNLLMEIVDLKTKKKELYHQKGPINSDYIKLSIKLDLLINEYIDEQIVNLM